jgi:phenylacetic acid degradation operon negative regulatory protein
MPKTPVVRTKFIVFALFGDYILPRGGRVWTPSLLRLLELLGVSSQTARSTLSRMSGEGWLEPERSGRNSLYALTAKGRNLLEEGVHRIFEPRRLEWDGQWRVVVYSLPEKKRDLREALRRRLSWLGYGPLAPGTWVSPHDRQLELDSLLDDLGARRYVQCFVGRWLGGISNDEMVSRCWELDSLNREYAAFVRKWEREARSQRNTKDKSGAECFVRRFWIVHEYSAFPNRDPNLPLELLPAGWLGDEAARVHREYREMLSDRANSFIDATVSNIPAQEK